jgi:hypothetical protein
MSGIAFAASLSTRIARYLLLDHSFLTQLTKKLNIDFLPLTGS